jgi:riboflavin biosynthesis pyrimidine reductase
LKQETEGDVTVSGPTLAAEPIERDLIDECHPIVRPIVLGGDKAFLPSLTRRLPLRLEETRAFRGGVVLLRYVRDRAS